MSLPAFLTENWGLVLIGAVVLVVVIMRIMRPKRPRHAGELIAGAKPFGATEDRPEVFDTNTVQEPVASAADSGASLARTVDETERADEPAPTNGFASLTDAEQAALQAVSDDSEVVQESAASATEEPETVIDVPNAELTDVGGSGSDDSATTTADDASDSDGDEELNLDALPAVDDIPVEADEDAHADSDDSSDPASDEHELSATEDAAPAERADAPHEAPSAPLPHEQPANILDPQAVKA